MSPRRAAAAALAAAALTLGAGCGDEEGAGGGDGAAYAEEVEAIMSETVTPAGVQATDAITNVAQGETDLEAVLDELDGVAGDLRGAADSLAELDPPEAAADVAEELTARIVVLADRLEEMEPAELERDPRIAADNVRTDLARIERRAREAEELAAGG